MVKSLAFAVACLVFVNMAPSTFGNACGDREIRIGFMGPYNSPISPGDSVSVLPVGFLAAVKWLNTDISNIFPIQNCTSAPNVTVVPFMLDSSRIGNNSKTRAVRHADQLYKCSDAGGDATSDAGGDAASCSAEASIGHNVDAVIADQYSSTATTIAMMAEIHGKPMIGYGSTSDELSNKHDFPYYNRVVAPDRYQAPFLATMAHGFGWRHIGIINGDGSYAAGFAGTFAAKCATFADPILIEERHVFAEGDSDSAAMDAMLSTINNAGVKIIMLSSAGYADTIFVLERAHALGMTGDGYIWLGTDGWMSADDFKNDNGRINRLREYTHGSIGIFHYTDAESPAAITATNEMYGTGQAGWQALANQLDPTWSIPSYTPPHDVWGYYAWDATVHTVRALAMANATCFAEGSCTQEAIRTQNSYSGATGMVELDENGDRAVGRYVILNVNQASSEILVPIGMIEGDAQGDPVVTITPAQWESIVWPNGATGRSGMPGDGDWSRVRGTCTDVPGLPAAELLRGMHLRIGLYAGELADCKNGDPACRLYGSISRADNKEDFNNGATFAFKTWSGFDVELIEELAIRGGFEYTLVSMGGGHAQSVGYTDYAGNECSGASCSNYTEKAQILLGLRPDLVHMGDHGGMVDIIGQGTWKVSSDRKEWAIWSSPVASGDTLLLTKPMEYEEVEFGADLMFKPFKPEVWVLLFALVIAFAAIFKVSATKSQKTAMEISPSDIAYHTFMQPCGKDLIDVNQAKIKAISMGWIIFCVVIMEFWFAGLVSQLVREGTYTAAVTWNDLTSSEGTMTLCTEVASANDLYFTQLIDEERGLGYLYNIDRKASNSLRISGVVDGTCDGSEVTREDYNKDIRFRGSGKCPAVLQPVAIAQRTRGMISRRNNSCIITGINALIHSYSIESCTRHTNNRGKCNLYALWTSHFPEPTCATVVKVDHGEEIELDIEAIGSPLAVLFTITVLGAIGTLIGRRNERRSVWPFTLFLESAEAQHIRLMQKLEGLTEAATAMQTSKASMKRRASEGMSVLPPPAAPPPDDGKPKKTVKFDGGSASSGVNNTPVMTETRTMLQAQLEMARQRAHIAQPTNKAYDYTYTQGQPYGAQSTYGYPQPTASGAAVDNNLPDGWSSAIDPASGHTYYIDHNLKISQWTAPTATGASAKPYAASQPTAGGNTGFADLSRLFNTESKV